MTDYKERLLIKIDGDNYTKFSTKSKTCIATGYNRIVIGKRGPYIEFSDNNINKDLIIIPESGIWRIYSDLAYYIEYRTLDESNVKIYFQKKEVDYADYRIGYYYISPFDLKTDFFENLIVPLKSKTGTNKFFNFD